MTKLISIEDFDPLGYSKINSPYSLKAMDLLNIENHQLRAKRPKDLEGIVRDADPVRTEKSLQFFVKKSSEEVGKLIDQVKKTRSKLKLKAEEARLLMEGEQNVTEVIQKHRIIDEERKRRIPSDARRRESRPGSVSSIRPTSTASRASRQTSGKKSSASVERPLLARVRPQVVSEAIMEEAARQIEEMVEHEISLQRIKEHRMKHFEVQVEERRREAEQKMRKVRHLLSEQEKETMLGIFHKKVERDVREFEIEVNRRAHEMEQRSRNEKIMQENERLRGLHEEREEFKRKREQVRNEIMRDVAKMREGALSPEELQAKYAYLRTDQGLESVLEQQRAAGRSRSGKVVSCSGQGAAQRGLCQHEGVLGIRV